MIPLRSRREVVILYQHTHICIYIYIATPHLIPFIFFINYLFSASVVMIWAPELPKASWHLLPSAPAEVVGLPCPQESCFFPSRGGVKRWGFHAAHLNPWTVVTEHDWTIKIKIIKNWNMAIKNWWSNQLNWSNMRFKHQKIINDLELMEIGYHHPPLPTTIA